MSEDLAARFSKVDAYPVETWNPKLCGEMDMVVRADGSWWHEGAAIRRSSMIELFAKLLRKEADGYYLVTPVEKLKITVEDLPYVVVDFDGTPDALVFVTDLGVRLPLGPDHQLAFDGDDLKPRVHVRQGLWARLTRAVWYRLVDIADIEGERLTVSNQSFDLKPSSI